MKKLSVLVLLAMIFAGQAARPVYAASITVNDTTDTVADDESCTLREAIIAANTNTASGATSGECPAGDDGTTDTITLANGATYNLTITSTGEDAALDGDLDIVNNTAASDVAIVVAGGGTATINQSGGVSDRVLHLPDGAKVSISGVTMQGGNGVSFGGGIFNDGGTLTLDASTVSGNSATNSGGGILNTSGGSVTIQNGSTIGGAGAGNTATNNGGGIYSFGGSSTLTVNASTVEGNSATFGGGIYNLLSTVNIQNGSLIGGAGAGNLAGTDGGGIYNNGGTLTLDGSAVSANTATSWGGGIFNDGGTLTLDASTVSDNSANFGGGIFNENGALTVDASAVSANTATASGGGIYNFDGGSASVQNGSTIGGVGAGNSAFEGGGIFNSLGSTLTLDGSTVSDNSATNLGGGIVTVFAGASTNVQSSLLQNNRAGGAQGGGALFHSSGSTTVNLSCILGNDDVAAYNFTGASINLENNWWGAADGPGGVGPGSGDTVSLNIDFDPFLTTTAGTRCESLLLNGSFEKFEPRQWWSFNTTPADGPTCAQAQSGNCSVMFSGDGTSKNFATAANLSGSAGDSFTASTWYRASNASGSGPFRMRVRLVYTDATEESFNFGLTGGTHGWQLKTVNVVASKDYTKVKFFVMYGKSGGEVGFDNVSLARDAPATGNLLPNFDFEQAEPSRWNGNGNITFQDGAACSIPQDGACTLQINGNGSTKKYFFKVKSAGLAGDAFTATIWNRTSAANGGGGWNVIIKFFYSDATTENFKVNFNSGTHGWEETTVNATASKNYTQVRLIVTYAKSGGTVYLDAAQLFKN